MGNAKSALKSLVAVLALCRPARAAAGKVYQKTPTVFAPYFEAYRTHDIRAVPCKAITLAFLLGNNNGQLAWDGTMPLTAWRLRATSSGKNIVLSFGGAGGAELALLERDPARVADAYIGAAKMYNATRLDFDIEGGAVADTKSIKVRNRALALVQRALKKVALQYTLPVMPHGLDAACLALLRDAAAAGVVLDAVNVMAMDYGESYTGNMGDYAVQAATAVRRQLDDLGMKAVGVGITPMIGHNDVRDEVFTLADAKKVAVFAARTPWVKFVGFWATGRDTGRKSYLSDSSMLDQEPFAFTREFAKRLG